MFAEEVNNKTSLQPERLRAAREKLGLSQHELARICGFGVNQISRYEIGKRDPLGLALRKMADVLGVSVDYLMGLTDEPQGHVAASDLTYQEREIVETFRRDGWRGVIRLGAEQVPH